MTVHIAGFRRMNGTHAVCGAENEAVTTDPDLVDCAACKETWAWPFLLRNWKKPLP